MAEQHHTQDHDQAGDGGDPINAYTRLIQLFVDAEQHTADAADHVAQSLQDLAQATQCMADAATILIASKLHLQRHPPHRRPSD